MDLDNEQIRLYNKTMNKLKQLKEREEQYRSDKEFLRELEEKKYEREQIYALKEQECEIEEQQRQNEEYGLTRELKRLRMKIPKKLTGMKKAIRDRDIMLKNRADNIRRAKILNKEWKQKRKFIENEKNERYLQRLKETELTREKHFNDD